MVMDAGAARIARRFYSAWVAGDEKALAVVAPEAVFRFGGASPVAGLYRGVDQLRVLRARLSELTGGTFRSSRDPEDVTASPGHAVVTDRIRAERGGRRLDTRLAVVMTLVDHKIVRLFTYVNDQRAFDQFFGGAAAS